MFMKRLPVFLCCVAMLILGIVIGQATNPSKIETIYSQDISPEMNQRVDELEKQVQEVVDESEALVKQLREIDSNQDLGLDFKTD